MSFIWSTMANEDLQRSASTVKNICRQMWQRAMSAARKMLSDLHVQRDLNDLALYFAQHPVIGLLAFAVVVSCGIPFLMFLSFAAITFVLTFAGFIIIEGTILTVASFFLCGFLITVLLVMMAIALTVGIAYLGFAKVYGLHQSSADASPLAQFILNKFHSELPARNGVPGVHQD